MAYFLCASHRRTWHIRRWQVTSFFHSCCKGSRNIASFFFTLFLGCCLINHRRVLTQTRQSYERRAGLGPTLAAYLPPMKCDYQVAVGCHTPHAFPVVWLLGPWYPFSSAQPRPCHWYSVFPQSSPWPLGSAAHSQSHVLSGQQGEGQHIVIYPPWGLSSAFTGLEPAAFRLNWAVLYHLSYNAMYGPSSDPCCGFCTAFRWPSLSGGPSEEALTPSLMVPNHALYHLRYTWI